MFVVVVLHIHSPMVAVHSDILRLLDILPLPVLLLMLMVIRQPEFWRVMPKLKSVLLILMKLLVLQDIRKKNVS